MIQERKSVTSKKVVPSSGTYIFSVQWNACEAWTLRVMFRLRVKGVKMQWIYGRYCLASGANCGGKRIITRKREPKIGSIMQAG